MPGYDVFFLKSNNTTRYDSAKLAIQAVPKLERGTKRIKKRLFDGFSLYFAHTSSVRKTSIPTSVLNVTSVAQWAVRTAQASGDSAQASGKIESASAEIESNSIKAEGLSFKTDRPFARLGGTFMGIAALYCPKIVVFYSQTLAWKADSTASSTSSGRAWKKSMPVRFSTSSIERASSINCPLPALLSMTKPMAS